MENTDIYVKNGFENRDQYLASLADERDIDIMIVQSLAEMLGPNEDFDGLISSLEDCESDCNFDLMESLSEF